MAQNEMKAKPVLPERVRSMEGLGVALIVWRGALRKMLTLLRGSDCVGPEQQRYCDGQTNDWNDLQAEQQPCRSGAVRQAPGKLVDGEEIGDTSSETNSAEQKAKGRTNEGLSAQGPHDHDYDYKR